MTDAKPRRISFHSVLPFKYSAGPAASRFFAELRETNRIMALRCSRCGKAYLPPRPVCGPCYEPLTEWVEVGPGGALVGYTVVRFAFLDPLTGTKRSVPYGYGFILLDGAATRLQHFLNETNIEKLHLGMRLEPVFRDERKGDFSDIQYFRIVE